MLSRSCRLSFLLALAAITSCTSDDPEVRVDLHWTITSSTGGSRTCLDVDATTVEWTLRADLVEHVFTYDCIDDSNRSELVPAGAYTITAKLRRSDDAVLGQCLTSFDSNDGAGVETCTFEVP